MWRWVRDRAGGYSHAVPAGFDAPVWNTVYLDKISSATAMDVLRASVALVILVTP